MNDPKLAVAALERIIDALGSPSDLSVAELAGLYSAARFIQIDLDGYFEERGGHGYASEKLHKTIWHIGALTGYDITNGHDVSAHRTWAYSSHQTLESLVSEIVSKDPDRG